MKPPINYDNLTDNFAMALRKFIELQSEKKQQYAGRKNLTDIDISNLGYHLHAHDTAYAILSAYHEFLVTSECEII